MKTKKRKRVLAAVAVFLLAAGIGTGAFFLLNKGGRAVRVYPLSDLAETDMWVDAAEYEGSVRAENLQNVYLSETQQVKEVFVHVGDTVKKGDRLMSFDTTLSDLELERQKISVQKLEYNLTNLQAELRRINGMKPYVPPTPAKETPAQVLEPVPLPQKRGGNGTAEDPYVYLWNENCEYDEDFIEEILPLREAAPPDTENAAPEEADAAPADPVYEEDSATVLFEVREYDNPAGALVSSWGMEFLRHADGGFSFTVFEADGGLPEATPENDETQSPSEEEGSTAGEIAQMRAKTQQEIREAETGLKVERLKLRRLELELENGVVTASMDGVVKLVAEEATVRTEGGPLITVSAGGAWYVTALVGELDLEQISVGDAAGITSWMDEGSAYSGKVTQISTVPAAGGGYGGSGNPNVSWYPVTVEVADDAKLQEGDYVSVTFGADADAEASGLYLEKPFLREENGRSFVFVMGEDMRLQKREVKTGRVFWGSTVEILDGLNLDDYIAFPYGKNVLAGARTEISDISALYDYS